MFRLSFLPLSSFNVQTRAPLAFDIGQEQHLFHGFREDELQLRGGCLYSNAYSDFLVNKDRLQLALTAFCLSVMSIDISGIQLCMQGSLATKARHTITLDECSFYLDGKYGERHSQACAAYYRPSS